MGVSFYGVRSDYDADTIYKGDEDMGINFLGSRSWCQHDDHMQERVVYVDRPVGQPAGNPDPRNFQFLRLEQVGSHVVAEVFYPDCKNYEGKKVLLMCDVTVAQLTQLTSFDPHFCDGEHISPFARFEPTEDGYRSAVTCAAMLVHT